ncbi:MAG: carboxylate-amine ligase [Bryobacteraceae bacterium]|nr:carboxylate-amine ligase [Bryobacteraceae bacterium]
MPNHNAHSKRPSLTLGIEEEFQTIDPVTRDLKSHIQAEIVQKGKMVLAERVKPEMHQSVVEIGTGVCQTIQQARDEIKEIRQHIVKLARAHDLRIAAAGTHPFAQWREQEIYPDDRYRMIVEDMKMVARANLIFGLHVHVGVEDRETAIQLMNGARYFLPHLLAISANSPFWQGMETGLKSYRCKVFDKFPRTNIPDLFQSWSEFEDFVELLIRTNCIDDAKKIWWDIRPHPHFPTLEFRICDMPMRLDETIAIAALCQAIIAKLYRLHEQNLTFRHYGRALIMENKWRAARYGLDGKLIDFGKQQEVPEKDLVHEILEFVSDVSADLGSQKEISFIEKILERGTGADRQLKVFAETKDLQQVVDYMITETEAGLFDDAAEGAAR